MGLLSTTIAGKVLTVVDEAAPPLIGKGIEKLAKTIFGIKKRKTVNYTPLKACLNIKDVIGRGKDVKRLWKTLKKKKAVMLTGFGGIGKTTLAQMLFSKYMSKFKEVAWIDYKGDLKTSFLNSIKAEALQIEGDEDKRWNHMVEVLINDGKKKLFVIDNVDHNTDQRPNLDKELKSLPQFKNTTVLLTSRMDELQGYESFNLEALEMENCRKLFKKHCGIKPKNSQTIDNIIELAHKNTLTIELLAKGAKRCNLEDYYHQLKEKGFQALDRNVVVNHDEEETTIECHLRILFDMQSRSVLDRQILNSFAILPVNCGCSIKEIEQWFGFTNAELDHVIQDGWLSYDEKSGTCFLHPLVRTIVRLYFTEDAEQKKNIAPLGTADKIMEYFLEYDELFDIRQGYISLQRILGVIESVLSSVVIEENNRFAVLYRFLGLGYHKISEYEKALFFFFKALDTKKRIVKDTPFIAKLYNDIGRAYWYAGDLREDALQYHFKALEMYKNEGKDPVFTAKLYNDIGVTYWYIGDFQEALEYHKIALDKRTQIPGLEETTIAKSYNNIGLVYNDLKDYSNAMKYFLKALDIDEKNLGTDNLDVATDYNNIGLVYENINNFTKALEYHSKALRIHKKYLGEFHSSTATSYHSISSIYRKENRLKEALEYGYKSLEIWKITLGGNHRHVASAYYNIGAIYRQQINYDKALEYYNMALIIREKTLNTNHPDIAEIYNDIGFILYDNEEYDKSLDHYLKALEIYEKSLEFECLDISVFCCTIGFLYFKLDNNNKMLEYYHKAVAIIEKNSNGKHTVVDTPNNNIGLMYCEQGNYGKALKYCFSELSIKMNICGMTHPSVALSYIIIGAVYSKKGDYDKALEYCQKAYQIFEKVLGPEHPYTKKAIENINLVKQTHK